MNFKVGIFGTPKTVLKTRLGNLEKTINNTNLYLSKRRAQLNPQNDLPISIELKTATKQLKKKQLEQVIKNKVSELQYKLKELATITAEMSKKQPL